ncbi:TIGR03067 domain-containing protein [Aquicella lusitana]|uniref:Uncharacterized protein (TIGR03067 family) n=1 Tax=Aquicella lusitana TaxID=254246 RepID=A0A370GWN9_9COXI|nr:TIGR03067 domain-containing protein [Aquicella lusitana]RDI48098.1 uncharacterized protein (TIGR03067 family) [Aquicella lusitana]VVC72886.1 hypothetical protein AQULUS_06100 [Aquicella lusitana]
MMRMHIKSFFGQLVLTLFILTASSVAWSEQQIDTGLKGNWKVIACQLNTKWLADSIFREFRYNITADNRFYIENADLTFPNFMGGFPKSKTGKIVVDATATPHTIDLIPDEGPYKGKAFKGIYELDHDILKLNFAFPDKPRPTSFTAQQGEVYEVWQRIGS